MGFFLLGTGFGTVPADISVDIDEAPCSVTSVLDTSIECTAGPHAAGTFQVQVLVANKGYASGSVDFEYELALVSILPVEGQYCISKCRGTVVSRGNYDTQLCHVFC